jgi:hypothetical protein
VAARHRRCRGRKKYLGVRTAEVGLISICAAILLVGIASTIYGYTRPPTYDLNTADMFFVVGIGMIFLGGLTTGLLVVTTWRYRKSRG